MITNKHLVREGGRPRSFENDDVFRATATVLSRLGYSRLSLDAVAQEVAGNEEVTALVGSLERQYDAFMAGRSRPSLLAPPSRPTTPSPLHRSRRARVRASAQRQQWPRSRPPPSRPRPM